MKRILLASLTLLGCQTTGPDTGGPSLRPQLELRGNGSKLLGSQELPDAMKKAEFAAVYKAMAEMQWDKVKALGLEHLRSFPGNNEAMLFVALAEASTGRKEQARFFSELVLKGQPGHPVALNILGVITRQDAQIMEDYRKAAAYFQLAQQSDPNSPTALLNLGLVHLESGNYEEARLDFKNAEARCGGCREALLGQAQADQALAYFEEAEAIYKRLLAQNEGDGSARLLMAVDLYYVKKDVEGSRRVIAELLDDKEADVDVQGQARMLQSRIENR